MIVLKVANTRKIGLITKTTGIDQIFGYDPISATNETKLSDKDDFTRTKRWMK